MISFRRYLIIINTRKLDSIELNAIALYHFAIIKDWFRIVKECVSRTEAADEVF